MLNTMNNTMNNNTITRKIVAAAVLALALLATLLSRPAHAQVGMQVPFYNPLTGTTSTFSGTTYFLNIAPANGVPYHSYHDSSFYENSFSFQFTQAPITGQDRGTTYYGRGQGQFNHWTFPLISYIPNMAGFAPAVNMQWGGTYTEYVKGYYNEQLSYVVPSQSIAHGTVYTLSNVRITGMTATTLYVSFDSGIYAQY